VSIRAKLLLLILFSTLIPAILGGVRFLEYRESEIADAKRQLASTTRQIAADLAGTVRSTAQLHYGLSRSRDIDTQDKAKCSAFLAEVLREHPQYTGILTIRPNGQLFCDSLRSGRTLDLTDRQYFRRAMSAKRPLAVEPAFGRLTNTAVLQIAYGVRNQAGETAFVLLASLNLETYMQARALELPRSNAQIALIDNKGTILTWHPDGNRIRGTSVADSPLLPFMLEGRGVRVSEDIRTDGVSRIWVTSTVPGLEEAGLHVLVGAAREGVLAAADRNFRQSLLILAAGWLLVFAAAWALVEVSIRRQGARITKAVSKFSEGDWTARIGAPYPRGEIGDLMVELDRAFGMMELQRDVIKQLNTDLERRVADRTAQLEVSLKELEGFTYTVSHDLRAPLRAINGFSHMVQHDYSGNLDEQGVRWLGVIAENSQKMGQLIDDLLAFSKLGREQLSAGAVDMTYQVAEVLAQFRQQGETLPKMVLGELPVARGDAPMLRQVWVNLLGNALKFSSKRAHPVVEISGEVRGSECVYSIKDNGAGFDMRYYDKLFGVFQRLHSVKEFSGTGVGLAIVQRIVSRHGGRVWAEGATDQGATFHFSLPRGAG
jgi:signal transduction histidine kinase